MEERTIPGFRKYTVATTGGVFGPSGRRLKQYTYYWPGETIPYKIVYLWHGRGRWARTKSKLVHRLVLHTFIGPARGRVGHHKNGDSLNNNLSNLVWMTEEEHKLHHANLKIKKLKREINALNRIDGQLVGSPICQLPALSQSENKNDCTRRTN